MTEQGRPSGEALFGDLTDAVAARVATAVGEAHRIGLHTQEASQQPQRYGYGSTWPSRYERLVAHLSELPDTQVVPVHRTTYHLARVRGRLVIPVHLARTVAEAPRTPPLSEPVLALVTGSILVARPDPTLFDEPEPEPPRAVPELGPVLVGVVSDPGVAEVHAVLWGAIRAVDDGGHVTWTPERLPVARDIPRPRRHDAASPYPSR